MKRIFTLAILALAAVLQAHASSVNLSWGEPTTTLTYGFNVYRAAQTNGSCGTFTQIAGSINSAQTNYSDAAITLGTTYCYYVTAYNTNGGQESAPSNTITVVTIASTTPPSNTPPSPTGLSGTFVQ